MRLLLALLVLLLIALQAALWFGEGGVFDLWQLHQALERQGQENSKLVERNKALEGEVSDLKSGLDAIEERARAELGMIGEGELFYQLIDSRGESAR
jgi:cell division protein FtsB